MKQKSYSTINIPDNEIFIEEVSPVQYYPKKEKKKKIIIVVLFILFVLLVGNAIGYYAYLNYYKTYPIEKGDLLVVHQNVDFGVLIEDMSQYTSYNNSNEYNFYIKNDNNFKINYSVKLITEIDNDIEKNMADLKNISFALLKNNKKIVTQRLSKTTNNILIKTYTEKESTDYYRLLLWSEENENGYYKYKIVIEK